MGDMMKTFVDREIDERIREKYPHLRHPSGVCAKIMSSVRLESGSYKYTVRILDENMNTDGNFPEIPGVVSDIQCEKGDVVVALLLYGGSDVYIMGRRYV